MGRRTDLAGMLRGSPHDFFFQGVRGLAGNSRIQQGEAVLLFSMSLVGVFFAFGQFHLFTTMYHNVPCNYLLIITIGLLGGTVARNCVASKAVRISDHDNRVLPPFLSDGFRSHAARS